MYFNTVQLVYTVCQFSAIKAQLVGMKITTIISGMWVESVDK